MDELLLAVDIGGTKLAVGATTSSLLTRPARFRSIHKEAIPSPGTPEVVLPRVIELALALRNEYGRFAGVGISIGGPLDHREGIVLNFPHLPGWKDIPLRAILSEALGEPAWLDNDANLGALAEHRVGAGKGLEDMVYLTLSTGIGGGVVIGGKLVHGVRTSAAEVGHITVQTGGPVCVCGNRGCLERMASGRNIALAARELIAQRGDGRSLLMEMAGGKPEAITAELVHRAAMGGDTLADEVWQNAIEYLAIGVASILHVLAPQAVVLGGGVSQAGDALLHPLRRRLRPHVHFVPLDLIRIALAELGHDSAVIGAALLAAEASGAISTPAD
jgi:glucokinase